MFVALVSGRPFGLIQRYLIAAYPEYLEELSQVCAVPPYAIHRPRAMTDRSP